ncbi:MAG: Nif3-like dinuclear metal center hexameric protein [Verrucomicrobia bacterium]|nr:Nif3-like dinuclear metal center hexameric protein [Verrucomicrobiota bacterium]
MPKTALKKIVHYCDRTLRTNAVNDYSGAVNGLQVENRGQVTRIAAAVDASLSTIKLAIATKADLLIVHHGLFWSPRQPWTGKTHEMLRLLLENNLAIYSSHLPLDLHPTLGNNVQLCAALGLKNPKPFFYDKEQHIGLQVRAKLPREELAKRLRSAVGNKPVAIPGGPSTCRRIGIVTGGAGSELKRAASEGVDTFITGEGPHWSFALAEELGVNVLYGGHYATETFGVKALAQELSNRFDLPWAFIDYPTGL